MSWVIVEAGAIRATNTGGQAERFAVSRLAAVNAGPLSTLWLVRPYAALGIVRYTA
jgi:hypothetical protein